MEYIYFELHRGKWYVLSVVEIVVIHIFGTADKSHTWTIPYRVEYEFKFNIRN